MPVILTNLRTDRVPKHVANRLWNEVANVDQDAVAVPERDEQPERGVEAVQTRRDDSRDSGQMRLEMLT